MAWWPRRVGSTWVALPGPACIDDAWSTRRRLREAVGLDTPSPSPARGAGAAEVADKLADAIKEELEQLGGSDLDELHDDAVLSLPQVPSMDVEALVNQAPPDEALSIWIPAARTTVAHTQSEGMPRHATIEGTCSDGTASSSRPATEPPPDVHDELDSLQEPTDIALDGGVPAEDEAAPLVDEAAPLVDETAPAVDEAASTATSGAGRGAAAGSDSTPGHDDHPIASVAATAATEQAALSGLVSLGADPLPSRNQLEAANASARALAARSTGPGLDLHSSVQASSIRELTSVQMHVPPVITPSRHMTRLAGQLPASALAEIYAGRHEAVPPDVLEDATYFLKYAYAVYYLQPKVENPSTLFNFACLRPPGPKDVSVEAGWLLSLLGMGCFLTVERGVRFLPGRPRLRWAAGSLMAGRREGPRVGPSPRCTAPAGSLLPIHATELHGPCRWCLLDSTSWRSWRTTSPSSCCISTAPTACWRTCPTW